jgi:hypothetical protein
LHLEVLERYVWDIGEGVLGDIAGFISQV